MARRNRMSVQKRLRERKKAEKADFKREQRAERKAEKGGPTEVASQEDLEGYGMVVEEEEAAAAEPQE